jgi:hypothetical protein
VDDREPCYSNFEHTRLMTYLTSEKYTLPKSEIAYVKNKLSLFLQLHEVYVKNKKKNANQSCTTLSETDRKKMRLWEAVFLDDFREEFLKFNNCLTRYDIDSRKDPDCDETFLEVFVTLYCMFIGNNTSTFAKN